MSIFEALIEVLVISIKRNGEVPLTNKYLLNMLKLALKRKANYTKDRLDDIGFDPNWD